MIFIIVFFIKGIYEEMQINKCCINVMNLKRVCWEERGCKEREREQLCRSRTTSPTRSGCESESLSERRRTVEEEDGRFWTNNLVQTHRWVHWATQLKHKNFMFVQVLLKNGSVSPKKSRSGYKRLSSSFMWGGSDKKNLCSSCVWRFASWDWSVECCLSLSALWGEVQTCPVM